MKKHTIVFMVIFIAITFHPTCLFAQNKKMKVGIDLGLSRSNLTSDVSNLKDTRYDVGNGISTGIDVEYNFFSDFVVSSGISFIQRNYEYRKTNPSIGTQTNFRNNFLNIPLGIGVYILNNPHKEKGVWLKVQGGVFYEYFTSMHRKGDYPIIAEIQLSGELPLSHVDEKYDFGKNENKLRRSFWGLEGMGFAGYSFDKIDVFASYAYQHGLTSIYKVKTNAKKKNKRNSHVISIGVAYKF